MNLGKPNNRPPAKAIRVVTGNLWIWIVTSPELVESQLEAVRKAGEEAVTVGSISETTIAAANGEYVEDPAAVVQQINQLWYELKRHYGLSRGIST